MARTAAAITQPYFFTTALKAVAEFFLSVSDANLRVKRVEFLNGLSDEDLQKRGIKREDIVRSVFADRFSM